MWSIQYRKISDDFISAIGAEARLDLIDWYGQLAIRKSRIPKKYRLPELDKLLRLQRTKAEVEILHTSKLAGVDSPAVLFADAEASEIVMEFISGKLLKELRTSRRQYFHELGRYVGLIHSRGIIHGDLTTKNIIISEDRIALIDFGLAFFSDRIEDKAEDLHLLKQVLKTEDSARVAGSNFETALDGYEEIVGPDDLRTIRSQIAKIELRGRYAQVD